MTDTSEQLLPAGWAKPGTARKYHFFREGEADSVCGWWRHHGPRVPDAEHTCVDCRRFVGAAPAVV